MFRTMEKEPSSKQVLLVPAICKELLSYIPGSSLDANTKVEHLARTMVTMYSLCKKLQRDDAGESLEGVVSLSDILSNRAVPETDLARELIVAFFAAVPALKKSTLGVLTYKTLQHLVLPNEMS